MTETNKDLISGMRMNKSGVHTRVQAGLFILFALLAVLTHYLESTGICYMGKLSESTSVGTFLIYLFVSAAAYELLSLLIQGMIRMRHGSAGEVTMLTNFIRILTILVVIILWSVGVFRTRTPAGVVNYQPGLAVPPSALLLTVKSESIAPRIDVVGTVASAVKVNLSARIPASVKEVFVSAGSAVKKGQELLTLDDREIKEQVTAAEAQSPPAT